MWREKTNRMIMPYLFQSELVIMHMSRVPLSKRRQQCPSARLNWFSSSWKVGRFYCAWSAGEEQWSSLCFRSLPPPRWRGVISWGIYWVTGVSWDELTEFTFSGNLPPLAVQRKPSTRRSHCARFVDKYAVLFCCASPQLRCQCCLFCMSVANLAMLLDLDLGF